MCLLFIPYCRHRWGVHIISCSFISSCWASVGVLATCLFFPSLSHLFSSHERQDCTLITWITMKLTCMLTCETRRDSRAGLGACALVASSSTTLALRLTSKNFTPMAENATIASFSFADLSKPILSKALCKECKLRDFQSLGENLKALIDKLSPVKSLASCDDCAALESLACDISGGAPG